MEDESFPRMWDQRGGRYRLSAHVRIIPTYVGSTENFRRKTGVETNHSHVCGINIDSIQELDSYNESFPRMWD